MIYFKKKETNVGFSTLEILISLFVFSITLYSIIFVSFGGQISVVKAKIFQDSLFLSQKNISDAKSLGKENWNILESTEKTQNGFKSEREVSLLYDYSKKIKVSAYKISENNLNSSDLISVVSDLENAVGKDTCLLDLGTLDQMFVVSSFDLGIDSVTDIDVVRGLLFVSSNSPDRFDSDLHIFDVRNPLEVELISEIDTGFGVNSLHVAGRYIFLANDSSSNQLQVVDIDETSKPNLLTQYRLKGSSSTTVSESIFYDDNKIYLGSKKNNFGEEFHVLDVSNVHSLVELGGFEVGTQVNDIFVKDNNAFIAVPNPNSLRILDLSILEDIKIIFSFDSGGPQKHGGQKVSLFGGILVLGRSIGFVNDNYHELLIFDVSIPDETRFVGSEHVEGSVRSVLLRDSKLISANLRNDGELSIWDILETGEISGKRVLDNFNSRTVDLDCDGETIYMVTEDLGMSLVILKNDES